MAYRLIALSLLCASTASAAKLSAVVEGGTSKARADLAAALRNNLGTGGNEFVDPGTVAPPFDDAGLANLRRQLEVARLICVTIRRPKPKGRYDVTVRAVDDNGVTTRAGTSSRAKLVTTTLALVGELPPVPAAAPVEVAPPPPPPPPAKPAPPVVVVPPPPPPTPAPPPPPPKVVVTPPPAPPEPAPPAAEVTPPPAPTPLSSSTPPPKKRKHEYGLLIGGLVAFLVPWLATVGLAAHYLDYNPNAARLGFYPVAGPLLARQKISDKDLKDGYDVGLAVDGAIQIVGTTVLVAGILYAAIGVPAHPREHAADSVRVRPLFAAGASGAQLGAEVTW
jgi:hypothetical protein